ncbi:MAG: hypothetical protein ACREDR_11320 [Blastocatellia bacterium]
MAMIATAEKFLAAHLGERYQESATPEVSERIKAITVDIETVTISKPVDEAAVGLPHPAVELQPGSETFNAKIAMGSQTMTLPVTQMTKDENGTWEVAETIKTPGGEAVETVSVAKGSLEITKRTIKQGTVSIEVEFKDGNAEGSTTMGGNSKPISVKVGGPIFADGAAEYETIAALPPAPGYHTAFRNFDIQRQKVKVLQLKVEGTEEVSTPSGSVEAYKVEVSEDWRKLRS